MQRHSNHDAMHGLSTQILVASVLVAGSAWSAAPESLAIRRQDDRYVLDAAAVVRVPADAARRIASDFYRYTAINPYLKKSTVLSVDDENRTTVQLVTGICLWRLCYEVTHVQAFEWEENGDLFARIVPELSDFRSGWMRWTFDARGSCTRVTLHSEFVPDFIVPPIIGPYFIKKKLTEIAASTIEGFEQMAALESGDTVPACV